MLCSYWLYQCLGEKKQIVLMKENLCWNIVIFDGTVLSFTNVSRETLFSST